MIELRSSGRKANWPRYELVRIPSASGVPSSVGQTLAQVGVPRNLIGWEYRALDEAVLIPMDRIGDLVAFGVSGLRGRICIEVASGAIVHIPLLGGLAVNPVNQDLDSFAECVAAVIGRFPFYGEDSELDEREGVAEEVRAILSHIDSSALMHYGLWETFIDDLAIGDYATEEVLNTRSRDACV